MLLTVRFFFGDRGTARESDSESGVDPSIDGHAMIAKPITTEKKRSEAFVLMVVERAARVAVVTTSA
jgi:hypothetical protein